jgi:mRNA interferase MazF
MNDHISTVIVVPMTTTIRAYPSRVRVRFRGKAGQAALDQIRAVDMTRLVKKLGDLPKTTADEVATVLVEMFQRE